MAISGDLGISAALGSYTPNPLLGSTRFAPKVEYSFFSKGRHSAVDAMSKFSHTAIDDHGTRCHSKRPSGIFEEYKISTNSFNYDAENFLLNVVNMNFFQRLNLAWKIIFPSPTSRKNSNAKVAKQRLKMILFSDRCAVSDEAKQKIVDNVVTALSDFVEIESQDKVQLSVSTDPDLGTIYSVTVPVRRVRSEYQIDDETGAITNIEYKDTGESSGSIDVKFDFYIPDDKSKDVSV